MLKPWKRNATDVSGNSPISMDTDPLNPMIVALFPDLPNELYPMLSALLKPKALAQGELLCRAGSPMDHCYFVTKGRLIELQTGLHYQANDWITDVDFTQNAQHQNSLKATEPCALLYLNVQLFEQLPGKLQLYLNRGLFDRLSKRHAETVIEINQARSSTQHLEQALFHAHTLHRDQFVQSATAQQVLGKVPRLPVSSMQLLTKLLDPSSSQQEVVELIRQDPSLTSTLLRVINSPSYGLENKISDIQYAISLLGIDSVYQIVVSDSMRSSLPDTEFFRHNHSLSLELSHLAFVVAQLSQLGKPAELATLGLMSQIGEVVVELLKTQSPKLASLFAQVDSAAMGSALLKSWSLPDAISEPLAFKSFPVFSRPENIPRAVRNTVATLYLASIFRAMLRKEPISSQTLFLNDYLALLNFNQQPLEDTLREKIVPALKKRRLGLPLSLRQLLEP